MDTRLIPVKFQNLPSHTPKAQGMTNQKKSTNISPRSDGVDQTSSDRHTRSPYFFCSKQGESV